MTRAEACNAVWEGLGVLIGQAPEGSELRKNLTTVRKHFVVLVAGSKTGGQADDTSKLFHSVQQQYVETELKRSFLRKEKFDKLTDRMSERQMLDKALED